MKRILTACLLILLVSALHAEKPPVFRIIIDAGHGGNDPGASHEGLLEKELSLRIARKVQSLGSNSPIEVIMTRSGDEFVSLDERSKLAHEQEASLLLSLHINHAEDIKASGIEVFYSPDNARAEQSKLYAESLTDMVASGKTGMEVRTTQSAGYKILKDPLCPAALISVGFLSNPEDSKKLSDEAFLDQMANLIWSSILKYLEN